MGDVPEREGGQGEAGQAAHEEVAERGPPGDAHVDRHHQPHQHRDGDGHVGEVDRRVLAQEQRRPRGLADDVARDDQEEIGKEQPAAVQVARLEVEQALDQTSQGQALVMRNGA